MLARLAFERDEHHGEDDAAHDSRVEDRHLPAEQSGGPVAGDPALHGAWGQADEVAELVQRPRGVLLQEHEQPVVGVVERSRRTGGHARSCASLRTFSIGWAQ